ncbi:hypothetical protein HK102_012829 [Quaeritorhiza haematococci]|nr:hypothetical protein HK102_012829 [Quaeritorhiza haematococci]
MPLMTAALDVSDVSGKADAAGVAVGIVVASAAACGVVAVGVYAEDGGGADVGASVDEGVVDERSAGGPVAVAVEKTDVESSV